jgi:peptidoglycan biosynthesis protein MviN/MurJ (putative lipid II flippase)
MVVSSFQALRDTATPVRVGVIGFAVSLPLKAAGFLVGGLPGLALAIVVHYAGGMIVMSWLLERRLTREEQHGPAAV